MSTRIRRSAGDSRQLILEAAADLLTSGGVDAVQVRAVAAAVGMTDAGVNHHFGTRERLLESLLRHGGRELRESLDKVLATWLHGPADVTVLIDGLAEIYQQGFGQLALSLHAAGWRDSSHGLLNPVVDAVHKRRHDQTVKKMDTRLAIAALHQAIALDTEYGEAFRRSAGLTERQSANPRPQLQWWKTMIQSLVHDDDDHSEPRATDPIA